MIPANGATRARVLIVDDEPANRQLFEIMLEPEGFELSVAASGDEALGMMAAGLIPDLVLLDIMMPGMNGYAVAARIRADASTKHVGILLLSSLGDQNSRSHGLGAGADEFLTKPVYRVELVERVRGMLRAK